ncbi:hypothetical protein [uncultured Gemella sp.]|uniref:hypothetical protein n=1 Tax=uncultured Gemella sp. TaxID=254352 RepID=UPI0028E44F46|nr:hypothetical protein [uncultured Gemella sp.]
MRKNNKVLVGLLIIVLLAVIGLSAYAYQKQKSLNNVKPKVTETKKEDSKFEKIIKESSSNFNKENELSKKIDILKSLLTYKEEISKENKDKLNEKYNSQVKEMREKIKNSLKDKISSLTVTNEDKTNTEKVTNVKKDLTELQTLVDKEKETIFEKGEDYNEISQLIKTNLATTEVTQTATTTNNSNTTTEQVQHTEVIEVPTPQRQRGTTSYTPPRVQNSPTAPSGGNSDSNSTVTPSTPATVTPTTPDVTTPAVSETTGTSE